MGVVGAVKSLQIEGKGKTTEGSKFHNSDFFVWNFEQTASDLVLYKDSRIMTYGRPESV